MRSLYKVMIRYRNWEEKAKEQERKQKQLSYLNYWKI